MRNVHLYRQESDFQNDYWGDAYRRHWVSYTTEDPKHIDYDKSETEKLKRTYLTFEILSSGNIVWKSSNAAVAKTIEYSKDSGETWTQITSTTGGTSVSVSSGETVQFRGNNGTYCNNSQDGTRNYDYNSFSGTTCNFNVRGNVLSLISGDDMIKYADEEIPSTVRLSGLFKNVTSLLNADKLVFCSYIERNSIYVDMFGGCTNLLTPPVFASKNPEALRSHCYRRMFENCTSLRTLPKLPYAKTATFCYGSMFNGCSSITMAPKNYLIATELAVSCYSAMFSGCTSLVTVPDLPVTTLADGCYQNMFNGCSSLTATPKLPALTMVLSCYDGMFASCTSLTKLPVLPATTLANYCYTKMFAGCTSLTNVPSDYLPVTSLYKGCYLGMFSGCTALATTPELPAGYVPNYAYMEMFKNCANINYVKCLATSIAEVSVADSSGTGYWLSGVAQTGTFVTPSSTYWPTGNSGIPNGWTRVDA